MLGDCVNPAELEAQAGHEQFRLVAGLAFEGDGVVAGQLCAKTLAHQADLRGTYAVNRLGIENDKNEEAEKNHSLEQSGWRKHTVEHTSSRGRDRTPLGSRFRGRLRILPRLGARERGSPRGRGS